RAPPPDAPPADLGLRRNRTDGHGAGRDRLFETGPLRPPAPGRPRDPRADRPAAVPRPARRALPRIRAVHEPRRHPVSAVVLWPAGRAKARPPRRATMGR